MASDKPPLPQRKRRSIFAEPLWSTIILGTTIFLLTSDAWQLGYLQPGELWVYDQYIQWYSKLYSHPDSTDSRIVLVLENEDDVTALDHPLHDKTLAALLEKIESGKPSVIGLDLYRNLPEPRDGSEIGILNSTLQKNPNILTITLTGDENKPLLVPPPPVLANSPERYGTNDFPLDNQTVRRAFLYFPDDETYASLAWMLAQYYLADHGINPSLEGTNIRIGKTLLPRFKKNDGGYINARSAGYQIMLDFRGPQKFKTLSVQDLLKLDHTEIFQDKIVLIGAIADSLNDRVSTPLSVMQENSSTTPGTVAHAQVVNQLLRAALNGDKPILTTSQTVKWLFGAVWCLAGVGCGFVTRSYLFFTSIIISGLLAILLIGWLSFLGGYWLPVMVPMISFVVAAMIITSSAANYEEQQREMLMKIFSQHVSPVVAQSLWQKKDLIFEGGRPVAQRLTATVLFTDLKDFSTISEKMETNDLLDWLNEYFTGMALQVERNGGIINKYIGDAIMAVFGIPEKRPNEEEIRQDAIHAVQCALNMAHEINRLNSLWKSQQGKPQVSMRIGINTGELMAGALGSEDRLEYTVIGDTVNTAARLESFDRDEKLTSTQSGCRILIGGATYKYVKEVYHVEPVGTVELKGKKKTTSVYIVIDFKNNINKVTEL